MKADLDKAARMMKLSVPEDLKAEYSNYIEDILSKIETLPELIPEQDILKSQFFMKLREDEISKSLPVEELFLNAPKTENNYFVMPEKIV